MPNNVVSYQNVSGSTSYISEMSGSSTICSRHGFLSVKKVVILISISMMMMMMTYVSYTYISTSPYDVDIVRKNNRTMSIQNGGGVVYIYKNVCIELISANSTKISVYDTAEENKGARRLDVAGSENSLSNNWGMLISKALVFRQVL